MSDIVRIKCSRKECQHLIDNCYCGRFNIEDDDIDCPFSWDN